MIFKFLISLSLLSLLHAESIYNLNVLSIEAKVFPKIILTDADITKKTSNNQFVITILYEEIDTKTATQFQKMIQNNYKNLKGLDLIVRLLQYKDFALHKDLSSAYFFLLTDNSDQLRVVANSLINEHRLTFCYDETYLNYGVIMGLDISKRVSLSLNIMNLKKSKLNLENSIFKVAIIK
ncbi:MAG: hypothetical protein RBT59_07705 [Arcobacteraceae bacterium]|jgi:hypothetical protein|nr:hypothetical protein [Arcobacteraceae bacterium]